MNSIVEGIIFSKCLITWNLNRIYSIGCTYWRDTSFKEKDLNYKRIKKFDINNLKKWRKRGKRNGIIHDV